MNVRIRLALLNMYAGVHGHGLAAAQHRVGVNHTQGLGLRSLIARSTAEIVLLRCLMAGKNANLARQKWTLQH